MTFSYTFLAFTPFKNLVRFWKFQIGIINFVGPPKLEVRTWIGKTIFAIRTFKFVIEYSNSSEVDRKIKFVLIELPTWTFEPSNLS